MEDSFYIDDQGVERRVFYIDVGDMSPEEAQKILETKLEERTSHGK